MTKRHCEKHLYKGAIHIHSLNSDGTGDMNSIALAAKKAGLSWIIVTDHNYFDAQEGIYDDVYVLKGEEITPEKENHYIALDVKSKIEPSNNPQIYIDEVRNQNGFGFAAHPDEYTKRKNNYPALTWNKSYTPDGVEIWNWFSCWGDELNTQNILTLAYSYFFKHCLVKKAPQESLNWWDKLNSQVQKIVPAIGGIDAHALKISKYLIPVKVFPYKTMFKTINNVIALNEPLSKDFAVAKEQILNAVKNGNNIIINSSVNKKLPHIEISNIDKIAYSGESLNLNEKTYLNVEVDKKSLIKVLLNGRELYKCCAKSCKLKLEEIGKYRVEVHIKNKGFAYSNPIVVV